MNPELEKTLRRRIRIWTWLFIIGLFLSGLSAIPLQLQINGLVQFTQAATAAQSMPASAWADWLVRVQSAVNHTSAEYPFLFYGTDWLAFGHFVIAIAYLGALRDPVRNRWLFTFGMIACGLLIPYAFVFGALRGIPVWWRLIDCSFGVFGFIPLWLCHRWSGQLENSRAR